jgi:PAS domain S-box-containing protein
MRGYLVIILGPLLAVGAFTALLAMGAGLAGWYREEMLVVAAGTGVLVAALTLVLLYLRQADRRADRRALQNVEARVGGIVESAMDPIISVDEQQRIVLFNAAAEKVFRWPRSAVLGQPLEMLIPARYRSAHAAHILGFSQAGIGSRPMSGQKVLTGLRSTGEEFPIETSISQHIEDGNKCFTVILRDVSERIKAEVVSARNEARLGGILDSAMDAIITVDEQQRIVLFNSAAESVFGCPRDQALGSPLSWFIPERFRAGHGDHVRRFGETGTSSRRMGAQRIVTGLRLNGEEFPIDASISQHTEEGGRFFTVILRDVTERVRAEEALRRSKDELRDLAMTASTVREQEKSRIARELHDELAQSLTALKMDTAWLLDLVPADQTAVVGKLHSMQEMLDTTVASTRRISADLRPLILDDLGLVAATEWLVQNFEERNGIPCTLSTDQELELGDPHATALFRILQESLTNVSKHAHASRVEVLLRQEQDKVVLEVRDNGIGFSTQDPRKPNSYGLAGLRERAHLLEGEVSVESSAGHGTRIKVSIPMDKAPKS